ncbi:MAG: O-antigen ligase family protein [Anaerolineae bacterium]
MQLQAARAIPGALAALALVLPAYRYRLLWHHGPEDIYFELRDWFIYLSDGPLLIALIAWLLTPYGRRLAQVPRWLTVTLALLAGLASLSVLWAPMTSLAFYQAVRLWLLFGLFCVVATVWEARPALLWGLAISGALQSGLGCAQFLAQHTFGLKRLGEVTVWPEWPGASVITIEGVRVLRAYGLTQHPNLLAGILLIAMLAAAGLALQPHGRGSGVAVALAGANFGGLLLTFSRAAWLALAVGGLVMAGLLLRRSVSAPVVNRRSVVGLLTLLALIATLFIATQWRLLLPRLGWTWEGVEVRSADERAGLEASAWTLIRERPFTGVGYGNFAIALWLRQPSALAAYPIYQPVHRAPLLAAAELGIGGGLIWFVLAVGPWIAWWCDRRTWPAAQMPFSVAASVAAMLAALTTISWFDFYPWFSPQGRLLSWIAWGLWSQTLARPRD